MKLRGFEIWKQNFTDPTGSTYRISMFVTRFFFLPFYVFEGGRGETKL